MRNNVKGVWALDVGQVSLTALKFALSSEPDVVKAEAFDLLEYPNPLEDAVADSDALLGQTLRAFRERHDLRECKVIVSISSRNSLTKFVKIPATPRERVPEIVEFESRQSMPFALESVFWDYALIGEGSADEFDEIALFAIQRERIWWRMKPLKAAGIEVDIVQMTPVALLNGVAFDMFKNARGDGSAVCLNIDAANTDLVITDGVRTWHRNVPIGVDHFTLALTTDANPSFTEAELLKHHTKPDEIHKAMEWAFAAFVDEVKRSIGFFSSVNRSANITKIVVMGNGFKLAGLLPYLQENLEHEVERVESFARLTGDDVIRAPQFQENVGAFAVCYGMGLQGLGRAAIDVNLLMPELRAIRGWSPRDVWRRAHHLLPKARDKFDTSREQPVRDLPKIPVPRCPRCQGVWATTQGQR